MRNVSRSRRSRLPAKWSRGPRASGPNISWSPTTIPWPTGCWRSSTPPASRVFSPTARSPPTSGAASDRRAANTKAGSAQAEDAGYLTARALIERGKKEKAFGPDGKLHMLAIAGDRSTPSSINRNLGMHRAVAEAPMVVLEEEVYAAWARENAAQQAESLYRRYPDVKLVWAGNDLMAFGAMAAWEKRGGKAGRGRVVQRHQHLDRGARG